MSGPTMKALAAPLRALRMLAAEFPDLPAAAVHMSDVYPERLSLALHDDLGAFEAWRAALDISPDAVALGSQSEGMTLRLNAETEYCGATVLLSGYSPLPQPYASQRDGLRGAA
ncbi:hypothetical protein ACFYW6_27020 [Streptomyces sp. NPDC002659]|uniref:hypothetical protein n=1 Tax=Streptomyces sp. NPDC002659 TaxID=3364656 RepID=UPI0036C7DEC6